MDLFTSVEILNREWQLFKNASNFLKSHRKIEIKKEQILIGLLKESLSLIKLSLNTDHPPIWCSKSLILKLKVA